MRESSSLLNIGQMILNTMMGSETEADSSVKAEGGASSSAMKAQRKTIHMELDVNEDDDQWCQ